MLNRISLTILFIMIVVMSCTQKEEHDGDQTINHNYYDNTTNNSSRQSQVEHTYKTNVECWIVSNAGTLVECPSL